MAPPPLLPPNDPTPPNEPGEAPSEGGAIGRNPLGWILLALIFGFLIFTGFKSGGRRDTIGQSTATEESQLRLAVAMSDLPPAYRKEGMGGEQILRQLADELKNFPDGRHAYLGAVVSRELGRPVDRAALAEAAKERTVGPARTALVAEEKPAPAGGKGRLAGVENPRFVDRLAAAQADERAGVPRETARRGIKDPTILPRSALFYVGLFCVGALGLAAWVAYLVNRATPAVIPRGEPSLPMTPPQADRFAWRGAGMMLAYFLGSLAAALVAKRVDPNVGEIAQLAVFVGIALYAWAMRGTSEAPMLSALRMRGQGSLGRFVLWGVLAAAANVPLAILVTMVTRPLMGHAPNPVHPSAEGLLAGPPLLAILKTFLFASVCAPIWEETLFRGVLFQGFRGLRWSVVASAALSSFLFASIHPQGYAAWPPLFALAALSCALVHHTRSLIPSMVMHALWNTMALSATLLLGPLMS